MRPLLTNAVDGNVFFFFLLLWTHSSYPGHHQHHDKANISTQWSLGHGA